MGIKLERTERGFVVGSFTDRYGVECSIQKSSLAFEDCILLGDDTQTPHPDSNGFVNIDNRLCFWRDTGAIADVPKRN